MQQRRAGVVGPLFCGTGGDAFWLIWEAADAVSTRSTARRAAASADPLRCARPDASACRSWTVDDHGPGGTAVMVGRQASFGRLSRGRSPCPGSTRRTRFPAGTGFSSARVESTASESSGDRCASGSPGLPDARARPCGPARWSGSTLGRRSNVADVGFDGFSQATIAERRRGGLATAGSPMIVADLAAIPRRGATRSRPLPRAPGQQHRNSSGPVGSRSSTSGAVDPAGRRSSARRVADAGWIHLGRGIEAGDGRPRRRADRSRLPRPSLSSGSFQSIHGGGRLDRPAARVVAGRLLGLAAAEARLPRAVDGEGNGSA